MNKIANLCMIFACIASFGYAQSEVSFRVQYMPQTVYNQTVVQTTMVETSYIGSEEFLKALKDKGFNNPSIVNNESKMETVLKTGKTTDGKHFPLTMEVLKYSSRDGKKIIPDGTMIYCKGSTNAMPVVDSVSSFGLSEEMKKQMVPVMQNVFEQIKLPEKNVKIGESFTKESPLSIPVGKYSMDMAITTIYTLVGLENKVANFDVKMIYVIKSDIDKMPIRATGSGKGEIKYDTINNFYLYYKIDSDFELKMKNDQFEMTTNSKSGLIQTVVIDKN